jgi:hypothetical protein
MAGRKSRLSKNIGGAMAAPGAATRWSALLGRRDLRPAMTDMMLIDEKPVWRGLPG